MTDTRLTDEELRRLEELAAKATPGPWRGTTIGTASQESAAAEAHAAIMARRLPDNPEVQFTDLSWVRTVGDDWLNVALVGNGATSPENAAFMAALDPTTARRLLTEVQQLRQVREALREAAEEAHIYGPDHERRPFDECGYGACSRRRAALHPEPRPSPEEEAR